MCYSHAFFQVVKSHVLVHNYEPFRHWDLAVIDNDGHRQTIKGRKLMVYIGGNTNAPSIDKFLVAYNGLVAPSFPDWNFYPYYKEVITHIQSNVFEQFYADSFLSRHASTWRRAYDAKATYFFCEYNDFSLYVIEQKRDKTPINVFKQSWNERLGFVLIKNLF
ncbi:uncharacterized protein TNCT_60131 [Trichonephila clavata]|uniref:Uncharacterized protein n=1 Tax=Trichonephila clavata TaxID=2740835 RepID=A0A8X6F5W6_TRICU|nr:uncharacterized protein TNCT_60131 [Trichonephila clavata]